ncbi:MAG: hypothetical protein COZ34_04605 [Candidatus Pacebacteria bacterium CG_4_10_14_3_um_filter_34_15]|nr:MAG: hypothetical protein COZ34_04605 [Candidatus Pacebacteria bacterium CG_4_10_14_3_um_filter_34_15]
MRILKFPVKINPSNSKKLQLLVDKIIILAKALQHIPINNVQKQNIFHQELLKSSLFSAKIEGNQLTLIQAQQIDLTNPRKKSHLEVSNVLKARSKIKKIPEQLEISHLQNLHQVIMHKLLDNAGKLRLESSAIFDQFGNIVYLTPSPEEIKLMLQSFLKNINQKYEDLNQQLFVVAQSHYYFEKIHPFLDGNGRTGRILTHYLLCRLKFFGDFVLPLDEYFNQNRSKYYRLLEKNTTNVFEFVKFFLEGIVWSLEKLLEDISNLDDQNVFDESAITKQKIINLLPRRQEILQIVTDHEYCSFNFISRRFSTIPKRTIANDISQLVKQKLMIKHGQTRGVVYSV